ncbi:apolipoprotein D [Aplysia californica]|uniref:Apolipoprotein D n=1 Tax=Aplysia californica TaxID=6500 RepID=A0ABM1A6Q6_APLCA|nr:apolipoprotein D [Aplysia californica]
MDIVGHAVVPDSDEPARLRVSFFGDDDEEEDPNYLVVDTDYETFAVVFSCRPIYTIFNMQMAWILTREADAVPANIDDLKDALTDFRIDVSHFQKTRQTNCPSRRSK